MIKVVRPARVEDAPGIARVHVDSWRTTYKGIVPDDFLANMSYERRAQMWTRILSNAESREIVYIVEDENEGIIGFVSGGPGREDDPIYKGELYAIYLLKQFHGYGLGRRLVWSLVESLVQADIYTMLVWVLANNPACRFYEALGGQKLKAKPIEIGGAQLEEIAYGWLDIRILLQKED
jgi:ribosomal protein S18 acetylase RimI-like enzyme